MNVVILGASGQIARVAIEQVLAVTNCTLTLYRRNASLLKMSGDASRVRIVEGDVLDVPLLQTAMENQDVVYANLSGQLERAAQCIVKAMRATGRKRLIFISSMGIYDEVPGER